MVDMEVLKERAAKQNLEIRFNGTGYQIGETYYCPPLGDRSVQVIPYGQNFELTLQDVVFLLAMWELEKPEEEEILETEEE